MNKSESERKEKDSTLPGLIECTLGILVFGACWSNAQTRLEGKSLVCRICVCGVRTGAKGLSVAVVILNVLD